MNLVDWDFCCNFVGGIVGQTDWTNQTDWADQTNWSNQLIEKMNCYLTFNFVLWDKNKVAVKENVDLKEIKEECLKEKI